MSGNEPWSFVVFLACCAAVVGLVVLGASGNVWAPALVRRWRLWRCKGSPHALALDTRARDCRAAAIRAAHRGDLEAAQKAQREANEHAAARDAVMRDEQAGALSVADAGPEGGRG